jgi:hypothetical protein
MKRTTLAYRLAALAVVGVLISGWLKMATADEPKSPPATPVVVKQPADSRTKAQNSPATEPQASKAEMLANVYHLTHVDPNVALLALKSLLVGDESANIVVDPKIRGLIVVAPREVGDRIRNAINALDVPPRAEAEDQIKVFTLVNVDPESAAKVLAALLPKGVRVAAAEQTWSVIVSGPPKDLAAAEAIVERLDVGKKDKSRAFGSYEVRVAWLVSGDAGEPVPDDLKSVVTELSRIGIKDARPVGQMTVRNVSAGTFFDGFQIKSSPMYEGQLVPFTASGTLEEQPDGALELKIKISTGETSELETQFVVPLKQFVVLATAPVGDKPSAFVVQVTGKAATGEKK